MKAIIFLSLACSLFFGLTVGNRQTTSHELTIDLVKCKPETRSLPWALGSESFTVKGLRGRKCLFQYTSELEGGYVKSECRVPISLKKLLVRGGCGPGQGDSGNNCGDPSPSEIAKYCKRIKTGNIFFDNRPHSFSSESASDPEY
jgi:hypothetical protein